MSVFEIENVSKTYNGGTHALNHINLSIQKNEFVCFLGPSGCGKSTLLELLAGLEKPSEGNIFFKEQSLNNPSRKIGFIFQDASLYPWRTIQKNVEIGMEISDVKKIERKERAKYYIDLVGLQGFGEKYPHQLSGGMRQRAGIARALANKPEVLLMDEPFGAVDHLTRLQLQTDLLDIWEKEKMTVVFVTHDVSEAVYLADRIILFSPRPGMIKEIFNVKERRPRNRKNAALISIQNDIYASLQDFEINQGVEFYI
ncbi:ABC transporter ATP-binding protein [Neobacillus sp. FSL H8-0543]|uniref:ABC transporter ATP-binding protein n=1 Tax=Neobacillus sp. FSL H8-0543 TaxID=2954672 RepID=UPI0031589DA6